MQALERAGLVRTLAEPNLTAISGEKADFRPAASFPYRSRAKIAKSP
jgi:pilus assembly protein CpaC